MDPLRSSLDQAPRRAPLRLGTKPVMLLLQVSHCRRWESGETTGTIENKECSHLGCSQNCE